MIYEPRGRALEYSGLACNLAVGCVHRCVYCYGPGSFRVKPEDWPTPRFKKNAVKKFEKAAQKYEDDPREILFSFASDPYMNEESAALMAQVLPIAQAHNLRVQILTKNPELALKNDCGFLFRNNWNLGTTIAFLSEKLREEWEPGAPSISSRIMSLKYAHGYGIRTWCSIEPVVDIEEALAAITAVKPHTDLIKVGKLNHHPLAATIDWADFLKRAKVLLGDHPHLIKHDLKKFEEATP